MGKLSDLASSSRPHALPPGAGTLGPGDESGLSALDRIDAMESRYRLLSESLERRVAERTRQLEEANRALQKEIEERERAQQELEKANRRLAESLRALERHTAELDQLARMSDLLQACTTVDEACTVAARCAGCLFPSLAGGVFLIDPQRGTAEAAASWGGLPPGHRRFDASDCRAIRSGRIHPDEALQPVPCRHFGPEAGAHLCAPLIADGETFGVLQLRGAEAPFEPHTSALLNTVAGRTALSLANIRLRESLRAQSIRDPLTGLYNRRYLEESIQLEERRARRSGTPFGILMLDLDHFKELNDRYGHDAGDHVLREFARVLQRQTRSGDIACRYGGEEFTVILPGATREASLQRAHQLREALASVRFVHMGMDLGRVTVSAGVAAYPDDGTAWLAVLQQADRALYRAKHSGRNRAEVPSSPMT